MKHLLPFIMLLAPLQILHAQRQENDNSFSPDREYFILRSGNAKLIIQADRSGIPPAVTYMLFDAEKPCQTRRKERALNYTRDEGCSASALAIVLGEHAFTALGHNTRVRWVQRDGVPGVEARWWAGGLSVTETFTALTRAGAFLRTIRVRGADNAGTDTIRLRFTLPEGRFKKRGSALLVIRRGAAFAAGILDDSLTRADEETGRIESSRLLIHPGGEETLRTVLVTRIPARGTAYPDDCGEDKAIPPEDLSPGSEYDGAFGLKAEYFNNPTLQGEPAVTRVDSNLCPYWDVKAPEGITNPDSFSVRWSGVLRAPATGTFRLSLVADDRARLRVDGRILIDCWDRSWNVTKTAEIHLVRGMTYPLLLEYAELAGWAGMRLKWSLPPQQDNETEVGAGIAEVLSRTELLIRSGCSAEFEQTRMAWKHANAVITADSLVATLYRNVTAALPGMIAESGRMDAGMFEYGSQWVRDGSAVALGLIHTGQFEAARSLLARILSDLVSKDGATVIDGEYADPEREELDQMGELLHSLKAYRDWTGDTALLREYRGKILAMVERPLRPEYLDSTGLVHGRREYWERTFDDAYELAYQTFMIQGLRDAADLAADLGIQQKSQAWKNVAGRMLKAMLHHPGRSLIDQGALIKRRNVGGDIAEFVPGVSASGERDDPFATEAVHRLDPDASCALPILLRVVDPASALARKTLDKLEGIWNARWEFGGYERYHSSSQQDQPGPWCFSTAFIARAQHDAGLFEKSRRSLEWLLSVPGGNAGAWYEEIPLNRSQLATSGIVPWASAEVATFVVRDWLGVRFDGRTLVVAPRMFPDQGGCTARIRYRSSWIELQIGTNGRLESVSLSGKRYLPGPGGEVRID
jgi:hypothetical protein